MRRRPTAFSRAGLLGLLILCLIMLGCYVALGWWLLSACDDRPFVPDRDVSTARRGV